MSHAQVHQPLSEDEYLRQEAEAEIKHELVSGEAYAMAGASERHNRIAGNVFYHLRSITRGKACRAFMADMKLRIAASSTYYYPDVMLVCDPADEHPIYKQAPRLIAEVLSPATANVDLREKWQAYRALPSVRYYLLVDSDRLWARVFFRKEEGDWFEQDLSREDVFEVQCDEVRLDLTLDDLYEDTGLLII
jgi:Uma2 family endonuclease